MSKVEDYQWVTTNAQLAELCSQWQSAPVIAVDTEFVRTDTFHARLGLIQIGIERQVWLIDPLSIDDWQPLQQLFSDPNIVKVFHALSEDAEVIKHSIGVLLVNVFDTQIAASLLGHPLQVSYAKLVEQVCNVTISKEETRSDWLARPLSNVQCEYAAADVFWLYQVYTQTSQQLQQQGRYAWVQEDSERQVVNNLPVDPEHYYLKLRGGWKLKGQSLYALKQLAAWRERKAREENCNRGHILQDKELIQIVERMPLNKNDLQYRIKLSPRKIRRYGDTIMDIIASAENIDRQQWPDKIDGPLPADQSDVLKQVRQLINDICQQHNIPPEVIAKRKQLESWLRSGCRNGNYVIPDVFHGWRHDFIVEPVCQLLEQQGS